MSDPLEALSPEQRELFLRLRQKQQNQQSAPLAFSQHRCWQYQIQFPRSSLLNLPVVFRIRGIVDTELLAETFDELVKRHPMLRAQLDDSQTPARQRAGPAPRLTMACLNPGESLRDAESRVREWVEEPFELQQGPLIRAYLLELETRDQLLVLVIHGFVADCFSVRILLHDWSQLYSGRSLGTSGELPALATSFFELAKTQAHRDLSAQVEFWLGQLGDYPATDEVQSPPQIPSVERFLIPPEVHHRLVSRAAQHNATLFMVLVSALQIAQQRASALHEVLLGTVVSCRTLAHSEHIVGPFANYVVLRSPCQDSPEAWLKATRQVVARAQSHQDLPFERLYGPDSRPPFEVLFVLHQSASEDMLVLPGARIERFDVVSSPTLLPVEISCVVSAAGISTSLRFQPGIETTPLACELRKLPEILEQLAGPVEVSEAHPASIPSPTQQIARVETVRRVLAQILGTDPTLVDPNQGFFALGLDSLRALALHSRLEQELGQSLPLEALFEHSTCAQLGAYLEKSQTPAAEPPPTGRHQLRWESLLTVALLVVLLLPLVAGLAQVGTRGLRENRRLSAPPLWLGWKPDRLQAFAGNFDAYWNDRFGFRAVLIQAHARMMYALGVSPDPEVLVGQRGWFFDRKLSGSKLDSLYSPTDWTDTQRRLEQARDRLAEQGIHLLIAFTPEKDEVYSENLPESWRQGIERYLGRRPGMRDFLISHSDLDIIDLTPAVKKAKSAQVVFQLTDRHWSPRGAYAGFRATRQRLLKWFPDLPELSQDSLHETSAPTSGGEVRKIGLPWITETMVTLTNPTAQWTLIGLPLGSLKSNDEVNKDYATQVERPDLPRALVFRNSMCNRILPFLSEEFSRVRYVHNRVASLAFANEDCPDVVVLLIAPAAQAGVPGTDSRIHLDEAMWKNLRAPRWQALTPQVPPPLAQAQADPTGLTWKWELSRPLEVSWACQGAGPSHIFTVDIQAAQAGVCTLDWWQAGQPQRARRSLQVGPNRLHWVLSTEKADFQMQLPAGRFELSHPQLAAVRLPDQGAAGGPPPDDSDRFFRTLASAHEGRVNVDGHQLEYCNQYQRLDVGPGQRVFRARYLQPRPRAAFSVDSFVRFRSGRWELLDQWAYGRDGGNRYCPQHPLVTNALGGRCPFCQSRLTFAGQRELDDEVADTETPSPASTAQTEGALQAFLRQVDAQHQELRVRGPVVADSADSKPGRGRGRGQARGRGGRQYKVRLSGHPEARPLSDDQVIATCDCAWEPPGGPQVTVKVDCYLARQDNRWRLLASWMQALPDYSCPTHPQVVCPTQGKHCPFDGQPLRWPK